MRLWTPLLVLLAIGLAPRLGEACAVCFSASDESRLAFTVTTVFLTTLPLAMIGGAAFWLRQRVVKLQAAPRTRRD